MKILLLTPQLPYPPRQGTTIRNYNLIRYLARHHQLHLFTFLAPGEELTPDNPLWGLCQRIETAPQPRRSLGRRALDTLIAPLPDMGLRLHSPGAQARVKALLAENRYHVVQMEGIEMAGYGLLARGSQGPDGPRPRLIFDDHNVEHLLQKRAALVDLGQPRRWIAAAYSLAQWWKLRRYEAAICRQVDAVLAVSQVDREILARLAPRTPVALIPNGMDLSVYPEENSPPALDPPTLIFVGKMDYRPNIDAALWFGQEVFPRIQAGWPGVRFQIVGMNPSSRLDALRSNPGIQITGAVADVRPYIRRAAVYVAPLRVGGGTRFKVLEALLSGTPLVSTRLGVEGIDVEDGRHLLLADTPQEFAQAVSRLLESQHTDRALVQELTREARRFVAARYDWERILPRLEAVYRGEVRG